MNREQRRAAARAQRGSSKPAKRKPGKLIVNPVQYAIDGVMPIPNEQYQALARQGHGALHAITHGAGNAAHGSHLAAVAEITLALVEHVAQQAARGGEAEQQQVCDAAMAVAQDACSAVRQCSDRAARNGGRWGLSGPELTALNECMELHEQFLQMAPQWMVESAVLRAKHRAVARRVEATESLRASLRAAA